MDIKRKTTAPFSAHITLGLQQGYSEQLINKTQVIECIQKFQDELIADQKIHLSVAITDCLIVLSGQIEPHLKLSFINYPKFPKTDKELKTNIEAMARHLLAEFSQNRLVIEYHDETIMLEASEQIDPRIKTKSITLDPYLLRAVKQPDTAIDIIEDEIQFSDCLQKPMLNRLKILINPSGRNFTIHHSRNKDFWYLGVNAEGEITSKGVFFRNQASGSCSSIRNDQYLVIFEDEENFIKTEVSYRNSLIGQDIQSGVEGKEEMSYE